MPRPALKEIMTREVVVVHPATPLLEAAKIMAEHAVDGLPVVDENNVLVGILTEYDLLSKGSALHLPTLQHIFQNLPVFKQDRSQFAKEVAEITALKVKDVMNSDPLTLSEDVNFETVVATFRDHHRVNPIPIVDLQGHVVGVVSRYDVLKLFHLVQ